jgi:hypothetical protein
MQAIKPIIIVVLNPGVGFLVSQFIFKKMPTEIFVAILQFCNWFCIAVCSASLFYRRYYSNLHM